MSRLDKYSEILGATLPERAFQPIGKRMTLEGGGGGGSSKNTTYTSSLPEYAKPYFQDVMGRAQRESVQPYQPYGGERVAGFTPAQELGQNMMLQTAMGGTPSAMTAGQQGAGYALGQAMGFSYDPTQFYAPQVSAGQLGQQLDAGDLATVQRFMSPYQQAVIDQEKQAAARDYQIAQQARNAQAVGAGAFGGTRQAVADAEAQRNLMAQLQGIQTTGLQSSFDRAQQALQAQRAAEMQAGTTNIQAALQAAQANQAALMDAQKGTEASRQFGAQAGLEAIGQMGNLSQLLGSMGEAEQNLAMARAEAAKAVGSEQQALAQQRLDEAYQQFAEMRDYEKNMINWYTGILYGQPMQFDQVQSVQQPAPSLASQLGGLGLAGLGLYGATR